MPYNSNPKVQLIDADGDPIDNSDGKLKVLTYASGGIEVSSIEDEVNTLSEIIGHVTVGHFAQNVTASAVILASNASKQVDIMATIANTGIVYIGASGVSATTGIALYPGDVYSCSITNTNKLYVISTVDGDDVNVVYYN